MSCGYNSYGNQVYQGVQWIPFIVPLVISAAAWTFTPTGEFGKMKPVKQIILVFFGLWLAFMEYFLYILQFYFNLQKPDPYCMDLLTYAFPSRISFYLATMITYLLLYGYLWNAELHWIYWTGTLLFFIGPQSMLVWMLYNTWQEALVSSFLGVVSTTFFMVFYWGFVTQHVPYLVMQSPWTWFSAADTWTLTIEQQRESLQIQKMIFNLQEGNVNL